MARAGLEAGWERGGDGARIFKLLVVSVVQDGKVLQIDGTQHECTYCYQTIHATMVKAANFAASCTFTMILKTKKKKSNDLNDMSQIPLKTASPGPGAIA